MNDVQYRSVRTYCPSPWVLILAGAFRAVVPLYMPTFEHVYHKFFQPVDFLNPKCEAKTTSGLPVRFGLVQSFLQVRRAGLSQTWCTITCTEALHALILAITTRSCCCWCCCWSWLVVVVVAGGVGRDPLSGSRRVAGYCSYPR